VIRDLAVMLADGGECVADLAVGRDPVDHPERGRILTSVSLSCLKRSRGAARERLWRPHGAPESLTIDIDATLITSPIRRRRGRPGTYKGATGSTGGTHTPIRPS
jgi:hypothetical protein